MASPSDKEVVLIVGGTTGLGFHIASNLLKSGHEVIVVSKDSHRLDSIKSRLPKVHTFTGSTKTHDERINLMNIVQERFPHLSILITNTGQVAHPPQPFLIHTCTTHEWHRQANMLNQTLLARMHMAALFIPFFKNRSERSVTANITSQSVAANAGGVSPVHSASQAGTSAFVKALREQMHQTAPQIRVTEITPPLVEEDSDGKLRTLDLGLYANKAVKQLLEGVEARRDAIPEYLKKVIKT